MKYRLLYTLALLFVTLQTFAQTYTYDSNYRLTKVVYGNGVTVNYTYDALGNRLTKKVTGATAQTYTISTAVTPVGSGTVTGGGTYNNGTTVELNAIPNAGYEFLKWSDGVTANPRTITVTMNQAFTAQFKESTTIPDLKGDIVVDGKVDNRDLNALIDAYLSNANATTVTDLDSDGKLSIADITQLVAIINTNNQNGLSKEVEGATYTLRKELMDRNDVHINPDGSQFYRTRLMLDVTKGSSKKSYEIGDYIYMSDEEDFHSCLVFDLNNRRIIVFANSKTSANNYGMDGFAFVSSLDQLSFSKESVFTSSNWGWYPYFEETDNQNYSMIYFSYAGYYKMRAIRNSDGTWSNERIGSIRPEVATEEWENNDRMLVVGGPQINNNGHEYVDLGLPSGTLWATCNVGATTPEETGDFYAWGETETKEVYNWETYKWCSGSVCNNSNQTLTKYGIDGAWGVNDGINSLELSDDVAHTKWGGDWRIPTEEEVLELINNCESKWETVNGVKGRTFTASNGNSIFLPATGSKEQTDFYSGVGQYWASSLGTSGGHSTNAKHMEFTRNSIELFEGALYGSLRYYGLTVRPVMSKNSSGGQNEQIPTNYLNHEFVNLGLPSGTLWATCNLGAQKPEETGCYYAWAETTGSCEGKNTFDWEYYKYNYYEPGNFDSGNGLYLTKYCQDDVYGYNGYMDDLRVLEPEDDAATVNWGGQWRLPTRAECQELRNKNYTSCTLTIINDVPGVLVRSLIEGYTNNSVFFPLTGIYLGNNVVDDGNLGYYWTASINRYNMASGFRFSYEGKVGDSPRERNNGLTIRPVVSFDAIVK